MVYLNLLFMCALSNGHDLDWKIQADLIDLEATVLKVPFLLN